MPILPYSYASPRQPLFETDTIPDGINTINVSSPLTSSRVGNTVSISGNFGLNSILSISNTTGNKNIVMGSGPLKTELQNASIVEADTIKTDTIKAGIGALSDVVRVDANLLIQDGVATGQGVIEFENCDGNIIAQLGHSLTLDTETLKINGITGGSSSNVLSYDTVSKEVKYQPSNLLTSETVGTTGALSGDVAISYVSGTSHTLPNPTTPGIKKTIVNSATNPFKALFTNYRLVQAGVNVPSIGAIRYVESQNRVYFGGTFTSVVDLTNATVANSSGMVYYDLTTNTLTGIGASFTGGSGAIFRDIQVDTVLNRVYVCGTFTAITGVANTSRIAYYDLTLGTWNAMGALGATTASTGVWKMLIDDVYVYAVGSQTAPANFVRASVFDTRSSTWYNFGSITGAGSVVYDILKIGNAIYISGNHTAVSGVANTERFSKYTPVFPTPESGSPPSGTWASPTGVAPTGSIWCMAYDSTAQKLYCGSDGTLVSWGSVPLQSTAQLDFSVNPPVVSTFGAIGSNIMLRILVDSKGVVWGGGTFSSVGRPIFTTASFDGFDNYLPCVGWAYYDTNSNPPRWLPYGNGVLTTAQIFSMEVVGNSITTASNYTAYNGLGGQQGLIQVDTDNFVRIYGSFEYNNRLCSVIQMPLEGNSVSLVSNASNVWVVETTSGRPSDMTSVGNGGIIIF